MVSKRRREREDEDEAESSAEEVSDAEPEVDLEELERKRAAVRARWALPGVLCPAVACKPLRLALKLHEAAHACSQHQLPSF